MNKGQLYIETTGSGPDLVLLHGWGLHGGLWSSIAKTLSEQFRIHAIDLPGHGNSPLPDRPYTIDNVAEVIANAVPAGASWVGWSLGGMVALNAALRGADIHKLVLVGAGPRFIQGDDWPHATPRGVLQGFCDELAKDYQTTLMRFLALQARGSERGREELRTLRSELFSHGEPASEALQGGLELLREVDLRQYLTEIKQQVLLIHGERDTLFSLESAQATAQMIPHSQLVTIKGAGHAPFLSHPDIFSTLLRDFLHE